MLYVRYRYDLLHIQKRGKDMRTTLNIDDCLFQDVLSITKAKSKTEAVRIALTEYLRMKRKEKILAMRGKMDIRGSETLRQEEIGEYEEYRQ
ncbi:MAG: type II toxin-antitoxin system VapB family antitoxin [Candidatus Electrothrix sp. GM3_4]|nr:type II toxin-antitoxin system VapB family antitoxin [Candidatus Electrothrix sp. GM3_4]